ncbi:putative Villin-1 [Cocos nucifera]|uniref:Putative Villin-1 n=1 Tax=Cocos nucifera TaxID=13894 RepID=A0A8K0NB66_COCNU|nr:putative Villin-1 [Cocos nucifera]
MLWAYEQIPESHPIKLVHAGTQGLPRWFSGIVHGGTVTHLSDKSISQLSNSTEKNTSAGKGGAYLYDIHFWLGKDTSQDEAGTAAIKTVELDAVLGSRAVQHRELQGHESDKFLSYFKPCIIPLEGGVASGFKEPEEEKFETRLYTCSGKRVVRLKQVPFARSSLNHDDVFILDTENKIYQFNGANSNIQERAKALEVIQYLKDKYHEGKCDVAIIDDGKLQAESDSGEFWVLFGGFAPIGKKTVSEDDHTLESTPGKLYSIDDGQLKLEESAPSKAMLENNKCYLLDCGAEEFIINQNRPKATCITQVIQGFETHSFKSYFESWPAGTGTASGGEDGRGKIADHEKIETNNSSSILWLLNITYVRMIGIELLLMLEDFLQGRIVQGKEPPQFIALFQPMVILKGGVSSGYQKLIADKNVNDDTYTSDGIALIRVSGTSVHDNKAVQVDAKENNLETVATSLSSTDCFLLQSGNSVFIWHGSSSTFEQQQWATKVAEFLKPGAMLKHAKEGTESSAFWFALGGKKNFTTKNVTQDTVRDPHLYTFSFSKGKFEVTEVYNFSQDDLLTEDILILDTYAEVFVWVGQSVDPKEKQAAFEIGQKYIELAAALEGLSPDVPLYKVTEGNEPCFFTAYFSWDGAKAIVQGNSFQKKLSLLFGTAFQASESSARSSSPNHGGPTQRASALAALSSAFNPSVPKAAPPKPSRSSQGSQRAAAVAALSTVLTAEQKAAQSEGITYRFRSRSPSPEPPVADSVKTDGTSTEMGDPIEISAGESLEERRSEDNETYSEVKEDSPVDEDGSEHIFSYEQLKSKSTNPIRGIDDKRREFYLSDDEFQTIFGMTKEAFYQQPKWKQDLQKKKVDLF